MKAKVIRLVLAALAGSFSIGALSAKPVPPPIRQATLTMLADGLADPEPGAPRIVAPVRMFTPVDIDKDGRTDWRVDYYRGGAPARAFCGTGGCLQQIYVADGNGGYALAFDQQVNTLRIERGDARSAILIADVHGTFCGGPGNMACRIALRWDGAQRRLVPTVAAGATTQIRLFDPLPNSERDLPPAIAVQAAAMEKTCTDAGFTLGQGVEGGSVKPTVDFNGDGVADWIVGMEAYCYQPGRDAPAEPNTAPPVPAVLMISANGGFTQAVELAGPFYVDIATSPPAFVSEAEETCLTAAGSPCPAKRYVWNAAEHRMQIAAP